MTDRKNNLTHNLRRPSAKNLNDSSAANISSSTSDHNKTNLAVITVMNQCVLTPDQLKKHSDPAKLPKTTEFAPESTFALGQERAISALDTAVDIQAKGYNVFAVGENGLGKRTLIQNYLQLQGKPQGDLCDWIYVHNFQAPLSPLAISLPAGKAAQLNQEMIKLWQVVHDNLQAHAHEYTAHEVISEHAKPMIDKLLSQYQDNDKLCQYLHEVYDDMLTHAAVIAQGKDSRFAPHDFALVPSRYSLTIMCHSKATKDGGSQTILPPIIYADAPSLDCLMGRIEYCQRDGSMIVDHSLIKSGLLHQANGGYLLIKGSYLLNHLESWHALKTALKTSQICLPCAEQINPQAAQFSLSPQPIPLNLKVILLGDPDIYDEYYDLDAELTDLFKIRADFHDAITRTPEHELAMTGKIADLVNKHHLQHFDAQAQAGILNYLSLMAEHQNKLSLHMSRLSQLMLEANRHALLAGSDYVSAPHIEQALLDINYRSSYLKELYWQEMTDGQQLISTSGVAVGQINALTIINYADNEFGMPARLTAVVQHSEGSGDILDIERDVELGGSLHAKGMLIMNSYLRALFSPYHPLNFTASLAFEQSYAHIDGDSATLAEACALISALAGVPISQSIAITGSMNQLGMVQAVGGINEKVAGFYDTCCHQGLTGMQGVILPAANMTQLMLKDDIIKSVKAKQFHIYGVRTLSEALTILAQMPSDARNKKGRYRKTSLFGKVIKNLKKWDEDLHPAEDNNGKHH